MLIAQAYQGYLTMQTASNYFDIPDADQLLCSVWRYGTTRPILIVRVHKQNDETVAWLYFISPGFFNCPATWKGAEFREGTSAERADFMSKGFDYPEIMKEYTLFIADIDKDTSSPKVVQILAIMASMKLAAEQS